MTSEELSRILALIGAYLPSAVRARFLAVLPESLRPLVLQHVETVRDVPREQLSVVEQVLLIDLEAHFGDEDVSDDVEALPLRVADVLALILRNATIAQNADIVRRLPDDIQSEVLHLNAAQSWSVWERRLGGAELEVMLSLRLLMGLAEFEAAPDFVAEILSQIQTPADVRRNLTYMYEKEPDSTGYIQNYIYGFETLTKLPDRELQLVLQGVDHWDLIVAMRAASVKVKQKVLSNLSERRAALFEEDGAVLEEADEAQIEMVQHQILDRARLLYEAGDMRTYMGSLAGQEGELDTVAPAGAAGGGGAKSPIVAKKKPNQKKYGIGIIAILIALGIGWGVLYWVGLSGHSQPISGAGRASVVEEGDEKFASAEEATPKKRRRSQLGQAAVLSGKALLMTGESIRPLGDQSLAPGDKIKTDSNGRASIALADDAGNLQVEADSEVEMGLSEQASSDTPRLDLRVGNIWVQVKDPALEVTSPVAQMTASEGALYHLKITLNATTILSVHGGTVWVQVLDGGLHVLGLGERLRIEPDGDVSRDRHADISQWVGGEK